VDAWSAVAFKLGMFDARIQEIRSLLPRAMLTDWVRLGSRLVRLLRDERHAGRHDAVLERLLVQARASAELCKRRAAILPRPSYPAELPITCRKDEIVAAIRRHQVVVIAGETGSGKTTQLPKMCLEAGLGIEARIGCTQPRRIAALSISRRIADELGVRWGAEVGCKIRFDDHSSPDTFIKLMTDGILLAETQGDPLLSEYNGIIIDEAHERSLNIDFLLGYLKGLLAKRPELKLIVTSATIDTAAFSQAFNNAPIIEVSGRLYPVEVIYQPFDAASEEEGDMTYIDAAARATEQVCCEPGSGDVLVFMPTERDIRETTDLLKTRLGDIVEVIPLFGRLSAGEQQRVFEPGARRRIIVATNIAETSLTLPNIRYVIDAGLARISRYNARTRTRRLPIEPVAQSSANQRKGRSGRLANGVCIRLYSEEDFSGRPPFTQPEIQRANLAEVILKMKAFHLGEIETFPFINPPTPAAIDGGYKLLQELGALDAARSLTDLGRDLARLPIDPTLGRMLLQAQHEHATRELLIIAAGLSIQDPRERPLDKKDAAAAAHKRFADPTSDFLTLLNLWNAVHEEWETLRTQNQRRKFCKTHFLSYNRMREWQDLHAQLVEALEGLSEDRRGEGSVPLLPARLNDHRSAGSIPLSSFGGEGRGEEAIAENPAKRVFNSRISAAGLQQEDGTGASSPQPSPPKEEREQCSVRLGSSGAQTPCQCNTPHPTAHAAARRERRALLKLNESNPNYAAIHRSILSGLLGHIAQRTERNLYKGAGNRQLTLFPGSVLYERVAKAKKVPGKKAPQEPFSAQPEWTMAGEIVETSQLFARTLAGIDPLWIVSLAPHLCRTTHQNPHWSPEAGQVMVEERISLYGLEIHKRYAAYGNINPKEATAIFIRSALVEENVEPQEREEDEEDPRAYLKRSAPAVRTSTPSPERGHSCPQRAQDNGPLTSLSEPARLSDVVADKNARAPGRGADPARYPFLDHNRRVRHKIEVWQTRTRRHDLVDLDQALFDFYARHIENVSSLHELNRLLRGHSEPGFLCATEADLVGSLDLTYNAEAFPDAIPLDGQPASVSYAYAPGEDHDGVTVKLGFSLAQTIPAALIEWAVPGLREAQAAELLRSLPKSIRRELMPFPPRIAEIVRDFRPSGQSLKLDLGRFIHQRYGVEVPPSAWPAESLPPHLQPRVEIVGHDQKPMATSRDLPTLRKSLETAKPKTNGEDPAWLNAARQWERFGLTSWGFDDLPERVAVNETVTPPLYGWPGLDAEDGQVNLRLFRSREASRRASLGGLARLVELAIQKDLAWLERDLRVLARLEPLCRGLCPPDELQATALIHLKRHLLPQSPPAALTRAVYEAAVAEARRRLPGLAIQLADRLDPILKLRQELARRCPQPPAPVASPRPRALTDFRQLASSTPPAPKPGPQYADLDALVPRRFLETILFDRLPHLPRYLKALLLRSERAALNPVKDQERARLVAPYVAALRQWQADKNANANAIEEFRWMLEEYKVSIFAQELRTAMPISSKRLDEFLNMARQDEV
jgi:ATP-dependent helicase HrpA